MTKPITPDECVGSIPDVIIECVNEFLKARGGSHEITITQDELIERICARTEYERHQIFSNNWLDIEETYRRAGWHVEYDKPGYNETYKAYFTFRRKK